MPKQIVTITGIRPDFIRMSEIFIGLDDAFDHVMVHSGQHYDDELSRFFFKDLDIRKPNFVLETGLKSTTHYEQLAYLSVEIPRLFEREKLIPDLVMFLGDSNSALVSAPLFKAGYKIGHIEGGMRSYDRRMPEEVNRVVCDYVSDFIFVYTPLYRERLLQENKNPDGIFVVGNTIKEVAEKYMPTGPRSKDFIVADIHRNENLASHQQLRHVLEFLNALGDKTGKPVRLVKFNRALRLIEEYDLLSNLDKIEIVGPYGFLDYLRLQYNAFCVVSDSGTSQEECPLLGVPAIIPRNYTERPESCDNCNSILVGEDNPIEQMLEISLNYLNNYSVSPKQLEWLGDGNTANRIVTILKEKL